MNQGLIKDLLDSYMYLQEQFLIKPNNVLKEPVTIVLGTTLRYQQCGSVRRLAECKETFEYIPLLENLEKFLSNCEVFQEVIVIRSSFGICLFMQFIFRSLSHIQEMMTL